VEDAGHVERVSRDGTLVSSVSYTHIQIYKQTSITVYIYIHIYIRIYIYISGYVGRFCAVLWQTAGAVYVKE